jgi:hypothetical protein
MTMRALVPATLVMLALMPGAQALDLAPDPDDRIRVRLLGREVGLPIGLDGPLQGREVHLQPAGIDILQVSVGAPDAAGTTTTTTTTGDAQDLARTSDGGGAGAAPVAAQLGVFDDTWFTVAAVFFAIVLVVMVVATIAGARARRREEETEHAARIAQTERQASARPAA